MTTTPDFTRSYALRLYRDMTAPDVAAIVGVTVHQVYRWAKEGGAVKRAMAPEFVSGGVAAKRLGLTYRKVDYWDRIGLVKPTHPQHGTGSHRGYTPQDLDRLRVVRDLSAVGFDVGQLSRYTPEQRERLLAACSAALESEAVA